MATSSSSSNTQFIQDSQEFIDFLELVYRAKTHINVLASDTVYSHFKKYRKAFQKMPEQHRDALISVFSQYGEQFLTNLDFLLEKSVRIPFAEGIKDSENLKIHLSSFYRMAKDVSEYYSQPSQSIPMMIGREESKYIVLFKQKFYKMISHILLIEKDRQMLQARLTELNGRSQAANDNSPFGAMVQMMSGMFQQLGINGGADGLLGNVKTVIESQETKNLVEDLGSEMGDCRDLGTAITKVFGKLSDPAFTGRLMTTVNQIAPGVIPADQPPPDLSGMVSGIGQVLPQLLNGLQAMGLNPDMSAGASAGSSSQGRIDDGNAGKEGDTYF